MNSYLKLDWLGLESAETHMNTLHVLKAKTRQVCHAEAESVGDLLNWLQDRKIRVEPVLHVSYTRASDQDFMDQFGFLAPGDFCCSSERLRPRAGAWPE